MRLISNTRKKAISGWLNNNYEDGFSSGLKLQKFLFFYETLSKIDGDEKDFAYLKGYKNGPVFSNVYGDYVHRKEQFIIEANEAYAFQPEIVNEDRAKFSGFLANVLNEEELSDLTHEMNVWSTKEDKIMRGEKHVQLNENDLNDDDIVLMQVLRDAYPIAFIDSMKVIEVGNKSFIIKKDDFQKLTEEHQDVLLALSENDELENPVNVEISDDGVLLVD